MIKISLTLFVICISWSGLSQELTPLEKESLDKFNIKVDSLDYTHELDVFELQALVKSDLDYRRKKRSGFIVAGAGALLTTTGVLLFTQRDGSVDTYPLEDLAGSASIILGAGCIGATIPFFNSAKKKRRQRDALIEKLVAEER